MASIPKTTFDGYLKRIDMADLPGAYRILFTKLFPRFVFHHEATSAIKHNAEILSLFEPLFAPLVDIKQPRRFACYDFPPGCYYSVCENAQGYDDNTLVHELRAYRNVALGHMVEVIDLGQQEILNLFIGDGLVPVERYPGIGILIHNAEGLLHDLGRALPAEFLVPDSSEGQYLALVRYPYRVNKVSIPNVIDLRRVETRDWFFETFSQPQNDGSILWPEQLPPNPYADPTIALSRFRLASGRTPKPTSFVEMLPTLMNPDLGGGWSSSTGSTVEAIGHWMRNNEVSALVYPSARCDMVVAYSDGKLERFGGWNLVDFRPYEKKFKVTFFDHSPWCWPRFAEGIQVSTAGADSQYAGSIRVRGMVDYWADDYLNQFHSLETAKVQLPDWCRTNRLTHKPPSLYEAWVMGRHLVRWIGLLGAGKSLEAVENSLQILKGLAVHTDLFHVLGEIDEILRDLRRSGDLAEASVATHVLGTKLTHYLRGNDQPDEQIAVQVAIEFEWNETLLARCVGNIKPSEFLFDKANAQELPLPNDLKTRIVKHLEECAQLLASSNPNVGRCQLHLLANHELVKEITCYFSDLQRAG